MATGFRYNGVDIENLVELYPAAYVEQYHLIESPLVTSSGFRINGQPIKAATGKTLVYGSQSYNNGMTEDNGAFYISGSADDTSGWGIRYGTPFRINGEAIYTYSKGNTSIGRVLLEKGAGTYNIAELFAEAIANDANPPQDLSSVWIQIVGGGGGGAGSGLTYCSAGGGAGGSSVFKLIRRSSYQDSADYIASAWVATIGKGGAGGAEQANGASGEGSQITNGLSGGGAALASAGSGGNTNEGEGGRGGGGSAMGAGAQLRHFHTIKSNGGNGGTKEQNGSGETGYFCDFYESISPRWTPRREYINNDEKLPETLLPTTYNAGGASNGNNYGGGGGASALADGAPANSKGAGVNGTLGAGGSGAGFIAFQSNKGGDGGDGVLRIIY